MMRRRVLDDILARFAGSLSTVELRMGSAASDLLWDGERSRAARRREGREPMMSALRWSSARMAATPGWPGWSRRPNTSASSRPKPNYIADYADTNVEPEMTVAGLGPGWLDGDGHDGGWSRHDRHGRAVGRA